MLEGNGLLVSSMQRLNELAAAANGTDGIPSVVGAAKPGDDSSVTTADGGKHGDSQKWKTYRRRLLSMAKRWFPLQK